MKEAGFVTGHAKYKDAVQLGMPIPNSLPLRLPIASIHELAARVGDGRCWKLELEERHFAGVCSGLLAPPTRFWVRREQMWPADPVWTRGL